VKDVYGFVNLIMLSSDMIRFQVLFLSNLYSALFHNIQNFYTTSLLVLITAETTTKNESICDIKFYEVDGDRPSPLVEQNTVHGHTAQLSIDTEEQEQETSPITYRTI
jgi:hypothetical protein